MGGVRFYTTSVLVYRACAYLQVLNLANIILIVQPKIISLESTIYKLSNDIYFVIYILYYYCQIYDLEIRASPMNRDEGSIIGLHRYKNSRIVRIYHRYIVSIYLI
jgi:hypothetical protein